MKKLAHYTFLVLVVYGGWSYWFITSGDRLARRDLDQGYLGIIKPATGLLAVVLHPAFSYAVLAMCVLLIGKEFAVKSLKRRFALNAAGFLVICLFLGFFQYWTFHNG